MKELRLRYDHGLSSPSDSSFRHPSLSLTFANIPYRATNNMFEQYNVLNETYKTELFVDMYLDGVIFWKGILDFDKIKRSDYYLDGSTLKYQQIKLTFLDRLGYFWFNASLALDDVSFTDFDLITDSIDDVFAIIDVETSEMSYDSFLGSFAENSGGSYDFSDLRLANLDSTMLLKDFLKNVMLTFACWIYAWNGKYYFSIRTGGSTKAIDGDYILDNGIEKVENANPIAYISLSATVVWEDLYPYGFITNGYGTCVHNKTFGDSGALNTT